MSIYRFQTTKNHKIHSDGTETWTEIVDTGDGLISRRTVKAEPYTTERTNCFCCSCGTDEINDPYCRNHGFAGRRRCDRHGMPGDEFAEDGTPLASVDERVAALRLAEERANVGIR